jgi:hypothetical protein
LTPWPSFLSGQSYFQFSFVPLWSLSKPPSIQDMPLSVLSECSSLYARGIHLGYHSIYSCFHLFLTGPHISWRTSTFFLLASVLAFSLYYLVCNFFRIEAIISSLISFRFASVFLG